MTPRPIACGPAPVTRLPGPVPGTCFAGPLSPWPRPWLHRLRDGSLRFVRRLRCYYDGMYHFSGSCIIGFELPRLPDADLGAFALRPNPRPPGSRAKSFHTCQGLHSRRAGRALAMTRPSAPPSVFMTTSAPETDLAFAAQWLAYALPGQRLIGILADTNESLSAHAVCYSFHRSGLSPPTLCRFLPAHHRARGRRRRVAKTLADGAAP